MTNVKIKSPNEPVPAVERLTTAVPFQSEFGTGNCVINVNDPRREEPERGPERDPLTHVNCCVRVPD